MKLTTPDKPASELTPEECIAEARATIERLRIVSQQVKEAVKRRLDKPGKPSKHDVKAFNRACSMARYAAHCARASRFKHIGPSERRRKGKSFWFMKDPA